MKEEEEEKLQTNIKDCLTIKHISRNYFRGRNVKILTKDILSKKKKVTD